MSAPDSALEQLMDETMKDPALVNQFQADPESVLSEYDLTEDEREMILEGDQTGIRYLLKDEEDTTTFSYCRMRECNQ